MTPVQTDMKRSDPAIRGDRIKSARMLAGYTRKSFAEQFCIPTATIRAWEEPPTNRKGITSNGAKRLIKALNNSGVYCTSDWLLSGKGPGPTMINQLSDNEQPDQIHWGQEEAVFRDINAFKRNNHSPLVAVITDNAMLPFYNYGDYVGGVIREKSQIRSLVGQNCIIDLGDRIVVRRISVVNKNDFFTLSALNMDTNVEEPIITNVRIEAAAQIVWHRSRESINF